MSTTTPNLSLVLWNPVTDTNETFLNFRTALAGPTNSNMTKIDSAVALKAPLASPAFTGTPTVPTPSQASNDQTIASTSFVKTAISGFSSSNIYPTYDIFYDDIALEFVIGTWDPTWTTFTQLPTAPAIGSKFSASISGALTAYTGQNIWCADNTSFIYGSLESHGRVTTGYVKLGSRVYVNLELKNCTDGGDLNDEVVAYFTSYAGSSMDSKQIPVMIPNSMSTTLDEALIELEAEKANIYYATCSTAAATVAKTITIPGGYTVKAGNLISVKFTSGNNATAITLQINTDSARAIKLNGATTETTVTTLASNAVLLLYFDGTDFHMMGSQRTNDTDTFNQIYWGDTITAGAAIYDYKLIMEAPDGKFYPLTLETGTGTTKTVSTQEFRINAPILFYASTNDIALNGTATNVYSDTTFSGLAYTANQASWTSQFPIYLKGTVLANGNFKLDNTSYTSFMTQTLPTTEDGFVYVLLGYMSSTTQCRLTQYHPMYEYKAGSLREYTPSSAVHVYPVSTAGKFDNTTTDPVATNRLNYNGDFRATEMHVQTKDVSTNDTSVATTAFVKNVASVSLNSLYTPDAAFTASGGVITAYNSTIGGNDIRIPPYINGTKITEIGAYSFDNETILSVEIPDTVTTIGNRAFMNNPNLWRVKLSNNLTTVANEVFGNCPSLAYLDVPDSVTTITGSIVNNPTKVRGRRGGVLEAHCNTYGLTFVDNGQNQIAPYTATITTTWTGESAPFIQTINIVGVTADYVASITPVYSTTNATAILQKAAWNMIDKIESGAGFITVTCFSTKPTTAIPIQLKGV